MFLQYRDISLITKLVRLLHSKYRSNKLVFIIYTDEDLYRYINKLKRAVLILQWCIIGD